MGKIIFPDGIIDDKSNTLKRADTGVFEVPKVTHHGSITAVADAGGGYVTVTSNGHGLTDGESVTLFGTTDYDGTYVVSSVATNTFNIIVTFTVTRTGYFTDENEYIYSDQKLGFLGTVYARRIYYADASSLRIYIKDATTITTLTFDGYLKQTADTKERRGFNATAGTSTLQLQFFGYETYIETYVASTITLVAGLLTYVKNAT